MNEAMKEKILAELLELFQGMPEKESENPDENAKEIAITKTKLEGDVPEEMKKKLESAC